MDRDVNDQLARERRLLGQGLGLAAEREQDEPRIGQQVAGSRREGDPRVAVGERDAEVRRVPPLRDSPMHRSISTIGPT